MPRFLIEIKHKDDRVACVKALEALDLRGSHFVTHAEFGCRDGYHSAMLTSEFESRAEAERIIPPELRRDARIIQLQRFTHEEIQALVKDLET